MENAKRKDDAMKTTKKTNATNARRQIARIFGGRRIDRMAWKTLARIYAAARPGSIARRLINAECRRCGYVPRIVLGLNAE